LPEDPFSTFLLSLEEFEQVSLLELPQTCPNGGGLMACETINPTAGGQLASFPAHTNSEVEEAIAEAHST
jgi:hypothetical protein